MSAISLPLHVLEPAFLRWRKNDSGVVTFETVATKAEAQGIKFLCPKCFTKNKGPRGTHIVICWSRSAGAPEEATPGPGRWRMDGAGFDDLTLNADPPGKARSVWLKGGCGWHGHVTKGICT